MEAYRDIKISNEKILEVLKLAEDLEWVIGYDNTVSPILRNKFRFHIDCEMRHRFTFLGKGCQLHELYTLFLEIKGDKVSDYHLSPDGFSEDLDFGYFNNDVFNINESSIHNNIEIKEIMERIGKEAQRKDIEATKKLSNEVEAARQKKVEDSMEEIIKILTIGNKTK